MFFSGKGILPDGTRTYNREKRQLFYGGACTMMRSLWSGVAGLKTHQLEMDVIGNNIANVNTTAYKSQATGFSDILYQTVKSGTGGGENVGSTNTSQVGLGSKVASIYTNISAQGSAVTTDNAMDLMITGPSFFIITPDVSGNTVNYSRDGSMTIDANGDLVTQGNGYYVLGTMGTGGIPEGGTVTLSKLNVINRSTEVITGYDADGKAITKMADVLPGEATSETYMKGNLDSDDDVLDEGKSILLEIYGDDGKPYTMRFTVTNAGDDKINTFTLSLTNVKNEDGTTIFSGESNKTDLVYDKHSGVIESATKDGETVTYTKDEKGNITPSQNLNIEVDGVGSFNLDLSYTTNYASSTSGHSSTIYAYKGDTKGQHQGFAQGELTAISFGTDGSVFGRYSNGQTIKKAHIAVAEFNNAMGLEKVGDNLYAESLNSGAAMVMDITKDGGYMNSGVLEGSNVDLAKEFTDMITTQRGFQANSKVITTSDEMLQLLKSLKR